MKFIFFILYSYLYFSPTIPVSFEFINNCNSLRELIMFSKKTAVYLFSKYSLLFLILLYNASFCEEYSVKSPNGRLAIRVSVTDSVMFSVLLDGNSLINPSPVSMRLKNGVELGKKTSVEGTKKNTIDETVTAVVPVKNKLIRNNCNELVINFKGNYSLAFRAYDEGAAYRFITDFPDKEITVEWENVRFNFAGDYRVFFPEEELWDFVSHYERSYKDTHLLAIRDTQFCSLPVLLSKENEAKILITEADLYDYPNMFLYGTGTTAFRPAFPKVILSFNHVNDRDDDITKLADYIAVVKGNRTFPWRVITVASNDKDLLECDLVYKLSSPNVIENTNWIKPGRVAWDWWNDRNIYNVGFPSGINTNTYKYFIDFASRFGLEYVILDEGWSRASHDLLNTVPELDLPELVQYAQKKKVGLILWVLWNALDENMAQVLDQFKSWGVKGIKVDFMQRGDQYMVNFYERTAMEAAKRNLTVDFHGAYKPSGLNRKYPNVLSQEGVKGLEHDKWSTDVTPTHDVTLPFTRMVAGPMD
ncbi:MAG: glycoside hydrolase family 97 catalytic domain-containing protein, partial [Candidatus Aminicenantes bacterium]